MGINPKTDTALKTLSKHLVQIRTQKAKLLETRAQLNAVNMHATSMVTHVAAASAVGKVTEAMGAANAAMDTKQVMKTMNEFQKQNEMANIRTEMMDDALVDVFDNDELDEEADLITNQVLAELGIQLANEMTNAPSSKLPQGSQVQQEDDLMNTVPDLKARLD